VEIAFDVVGRPAPQGSKKSIGNNRFVESSKFLPPWRNAIRLAAEEAVTANGWARVSGPVELEVMFYLDRPSSVSPVKRPQPTVPPDLDKLIRGVGVPGAFIRVNELSQFDNGAFQSFDFLDLPD